MFCISESDFLLAEHHLKNSVKGLKIKGFFESGKVYFNSDILIKKFEKWFQEREKELKEK